MPGSERAYPGRAWGGANKEERGNEKHPLIDVITFQNLLVLYCENSQLCLTQTEKTHQVGN